MNKLPKSLRRLLFEEEEVPGSDQVATIPGPPPDVTEEEIGMHILQNTPEFGEIDPEFVEPLCADNSCPLPGDPVPDSIIEAAIKEWENLLR